MANDSILEQVNRIFIDVLDNDHIKLTPATTTKDIEEWDSLSHIQLVVAIEKKFKIRFTAADIQKWKNVGELVQDIQQQATFKMITSFHHVGCLVENIDDAISDYLKLYPTGIVSEIFTINEQQVKYCFFTIVNMNIEFVEPGNEQSTLYRMLKKNPGFYHVGLYTDDIEGEIIRLEKEGYHIINKFRSVAFENHLCSFLYNNEHHLIELIQI